ncbi:DUF2970 domain-containing protein [Massilia sp. 9096]|uniref:DUF2970 domain-containing protein n=1 Tax=Massilia sp. 9096 TaxID=1500894 RepID=UPI0005686DE4|nr:DUF2970 domain-containing protein [Massilia sp. 9096]
MDADRDKPAPRKAGFGATMRAVFWSFFGVRKRKDYEHDAAHLNPLHLIVAALVGVALFIGVLVVLVRIAVARG